MHESSPPQNLDHPTDKYQLYEQKYEAQIRAAEERYRVFRRAAFLASVASLVITIYVGAYLCAKCVPKYVTIAVFGIFLPCFPLMHNYTPRDQKAVLYKVGIAVFAVAFAVQVAFVYDLQTVTLCDGGLVVCFTNSAMRDFIKSEKESATRAQCDDLRAYQQGLRVRMTAQGVCHSDAHPNADCRTLFNDKIISGPFMALQITVAGLQFLHIVLLVCWLRVLKVTELPLARVYDVGGGGGSGNDNWVMQKTDADHAKPKKVQPSPANDVSDVPRMEMSSLDPRNASDTKHLRAGDDQRASDDLRASDDQRTKNSRPHLKRKGGGVKNTSLVFAKHALE